MNTSEQSMMHLEAGYNCSMKGGTLCYNTSLDGHVTKKRNRMCMTSMPL